MFNFRHLFNDKIHKISLNKNNFFLAPITVTYLQNKGLPVPGCNSALFKPGYFLSNEPGYYKEGDFGVRLENVIEVVPASVPVNEKK